MKELEKIWKSDVKKVRKNVTEGGSKKEELEKTREEKEVQHSLKESLEMEMNSYLKEFTQWENGIISFKKKV